MTADSSKVDETESSKNVEIISDDEEASSETKRSSQQPILVYDHKNGKVELYNSQLKCLEKGAYLNDSIVQFYVAYLQSEICLDAVADRVHIFDNMFYNSLDTTLTTPPKSINQSKFQKLAKWSSDIDIFKKDFLIFPMCKDDHWLVIVVCYPGEVRPLEEFIIDPVAYRNYKYKDANRIPGIIVMDSLKQTSSKITFKIREFLELTWRDRLDEPLKRFSYVDLEDYLPKLPKQKNEYDCGIYMLMYLRTFLEMPDEFYELSRAADDISAKGLRLKVRSCLKENERENLIDLIKSKCK